MGCVDAETTAHNGRGVLVRIYYPCVETTAHSAWLPRRLFYAVGYGSFLRLPKAVSVAVLAPLLGVYRTSAHHEAPVHPSADFPVAVFCHGLGGMRTSYSGVCGNLASQGFIVASIEFSDASASRTHRASETIEYSLPNWDDIAKGETRDDYLLRFRKAQILHRSLEVSEAMLLLNHLNQGLSSNKDLDNGTSNNGESGKPDGPKTNNGNSATPNFNNGNSATTSTIKLGKSKFDWDQFKSKIKLDQAVLVGHSFGAATALKVLSQPNAFKCGVILDPWMHAVTDLPPCKTPLLNFQSEVFTMLI